MAGLAVRDVHKSYGSTAVIHGVSIDIDDGDFVVLVGPSGCGKSTLLRMIAGLEPITKGEIRLGGRVINGLPPKARDMAMVFQNYALYPNMTVFENMGFSLKLSKVDKREIQQRVGKAAEILGLDPLLDRYPRQLSGGQRQRVAMGRAIVRDPQVFLFDEPLSNLDAKLRVAMRTEIKELHQRLKTTTVYVTHDQVEAMTMADKIVVMHDGVVEQFGEPLELYDRPRNLFVAGFIGSPAMNFLNGVLGTDGGRMVFRSEGGLQFPVDGMNGSVGDRHVVLGIRPEHIVLTPNGVPAEVAVVEPTGSETQVGFKNGRQDLICLFRERIVARPGETMRIAPMPGCTHLFDAQTTERLGGA
ncbi:MAG TPA: sn-glycerol-3-phosphate ABC transporter ATP-binding protein UgpC [Casimicrobiaceae bacterium]